MVARHPMVVACATDDVFAPHCATMLRSLLATQAGAATEIHVLHDPGLSADSRSKLSRACDGRLNLLEVPAALLRQLPTTRFHVACWYKVLLPELLPAHGRALYLDSDALVLQPLSALWETDLQGHLFGAVVNPLYPFMRDRARELGLARPDEYLNSGVLLLDLAAMRQERVVERIREYAHRHPNNRWPEQDALSVVCRGRWQALHPRWNAQSTLFDLEPRDLPLPPDQVAEATAHPAVVHFIGPHKPWHYLCRHPLRHLYARYRRETPWPQFELEGRSMANRLIRPFSLAMQVRLRNALQSRYRRLKAWWRERRRLGPRLMRTFARLYPTATFLQLGSNDGSKHDPLRAALLRSHWTGVMVEPVPYVFERLRANYGSTPRVRLENVAVAARAGSMPFYYLKPAAAHERLVDWYDELGSFRKDVILTHADVIPQLEQRLVCVDVDCVTVQDVCRRNGLHSVDLLHTDLEGYDFELIKSIDFDRTRPLLLVYEHKHLGAEDRRQARARLRDAGYEAFEEVADTWCVDTRVRDARHGRLLRAFRRIGAGAPA